MAFDLTEMSKSDLGAKLQRLSDANSRKNKALAEQPAKLAAVHAVCVGAGAVGNAVVDHYIGELGGYDASKVISAVTIATGWLLFDSPELVMFGTGMGAPHIAQMTRDALEKTA